MSQFRCAIRCLAACGLLAFSNCYGALEVSVKCAGPKAPSMVCGSRPGSRAGWHEGWTAGDNTQLAMAQAVAEYIQQSARNLQVTPILPGKGVGNYELRVTLSDDVAGGTNSGYSLQTELRVSDNPSLLQDFPWQLNLDKKGGLAPERFPPALYDTLARYFSEQHRPLSERLYDEIPLGSGAELFKQKPSLPIPSPTLSDYEVLLPVSRPSRLVFAQFRLEFTVMENGEFRPQALWLMGDKCVSDAKNKKAGLVAYPWATKAHQDQQELKSMKPQVDTLLSMSSDNLFFLAEPPQITRPCNAVQASQ